MRRIGRRRSALTMSPVNTLKAGQAHTEYGLILMLIGLTVIGALTLLGQSVHEMWHTVTASMPR
jgi:Flp pilus assembly pilin Flp